MARMVEYRERTTSAPGCDLLVLTCSDWRIWEENLRLHLAQWHDADVRYDLLSLPGSISDLVHGTSAQQGAILGWMDLLMSVHRPQKVVLIPHMHCAVYHARIAFRSEEDERAVITADIGRAREIVVARHPAVTVHGYIAEIDRNVERLSGLSHTRYSRPPPPDSDE